MAGFDDDDLDDYDDDDEEEEQDNESDEQEDEDEQNLVEQNDNNEQDDNDEQDDDNKQNKNKNDNKKSNKINLKKIQDASKAVGKKILSFLSKAIGPILITLLCVLILFLLITAFISLIGTINPILVGDDADGMSSPLGAKGDCFYGVRTIYRDAEKSKDDLRDDYVDMLTYTISNFESSDVTLNITLPAEDYNFADFETSTTYEDAYNMVLKLARIVYAVDNSVNVETAPANLNDLFAGIKYFGVDADFVDEIAVSWAGYVFNNSLYTAGQDVQVDASTFSGEFENLLLTEFAANETNRTEMFYVKDYLFEDDESYAENIPSKDYVAYIFMPKKAVNISSISFLVSEQSEGFKMFINNNGNITELSGEIFDEFDEDNEDLIYQLNVNTNMPIFEDLDVNNVANDVSLYNILHNLNAEHYLSKGEGNVYTFKSGALEAIFENGAPFYMAEFETDYSTAAQ